MAPPWVRLDEDGATRCARCVRSLREHELVVQWFTVPSTVIGHSTEVVCPNCLTGEDMPFVEETETWYERLMRGRGEQGRS